MSLECSVNIAILGAGVAGLGAALRAREIGDDYMVYEAGQTAGGLLDNFCIKGFRFDNAVHLSFATEQKVREIFDKTPYWTHPSDSYNYDNGIWLKHPVQNNLYPLPLLDKVDLLSSFHERPNELHSDDYESWLRHQYGHAIAERYPLRYTKKYWQKEASALSTTWIGSRMRRADYKEVIFGALTPQTPNTYYTSEMRYPKKGGYKAFIEPLISETKVTFGRKAVGINLEKNYIEFESGHVVHYKRLISSLPLPVLIGNLIGSVPDSVLNAASELEATSIDLVSVGFTNPNVAKNLWFYIYDEDIYASRVYSPSVKSPENVPAGCSSLQFEIYNPGRQSQYSKQELITNVRYAIKKMNLADESEIAFMHHKHLPWGNVTFKKGMEQYRDQIRGFLGGYEISSIGRFGEWDYLWSNQSLLSGYYSV